MFVPTKLKLQAGLPPVTISTDRGPATLPCVFRERGIAIAAASPPNSGDVEAYSLTHEVSGNALAPILTKAAHALALAAGLLHLPVDWTQDETAVQAQIRGLSETQRDLLWCIGAGRVQLTEMGQA
ncbi:hypothetical protein ACLEPN_19320 [Myxococcus sp. 1LA]